MRFAFFFAFLVVNEPSFSDDLSNSTDRFVSRATGLDYESSPAGIGVFMQDLERMRPDLHEEVKERFEDMLSQKRTASTIRWVGYSVGGASTLVGLAFVLFPSLVTTQLLAPNLGGTSFDMHQQNMSKWSEDFDARSADFNREFERRQKAFDEDFRRRSEEFDRSFNRNKSNNVSQEEQAPNSSNNGAQIDNTLGYILIGSGLAVLLGTAILSDFIAPSKAEWEEFGERVEALNIENEHRSMLVKAPETTFQVVPQWNTDAIGFTMRLTF